MWFLCNQLHSSLCTILHGSLCTPLHGSTSIVHILLLISVVSCYCIWFSFYPATWFPLYSARRLSLYSATWFSMYSATWFPFYPATWFPFYPATWFSLYSATRFSLYPATWFSLYSATRFLCTLLHGSLCTIPCNRDQRGQHSTLARGVTHYRTHFVLIPLMHLDYVLVCYMSHLPSFYNLHDYSFALLYM
jgi:hypothetical protein